eukprot:4237217-Amphidinium_carterae.1
MDSHRFPSMKSREMKLKGTKFNEKDKAHRVLLRPYTRDLCRVIPCECPFLGFARRAECKTC